MLAKVQAIALPAHGTESKGDAPCPEVPVTSLPSYGIESVCAGRRSVSGFTRGPPVSKARVLASRGELGLVALRFDPRPAYGRRNVSGFT